VYILRWHTRDMKFLKHNPKHFKQYNKRFKQYNKRFKQSSALQCFTSAKVFFIGIIMNKFFPGCVSDMLP
jgi:hypothetical protein